MSKHAWLIYVAFFALIGFAVWYTHSPSCLWALFLSPTLTWDSDDKKNDKDDRDI